VNIPKIRLTRTLGPPYADSWWSADPYLQRVERMSISTSQNTSTGWWLQGCHTSPRILPWACPRGRVAFGNSNTIEKNLSFFSVYKFFSLLFSTQMVFRWNSTKPQGLYPSGFPRHQLHIGAPNPPNSANSRPRICPRRCSQDHFHCKKVLFQNHVMFIFSNLF
jgi:hypothetical protein